ncbi:recombinase family protein [Alkalibacillus sp. S2W]|uniref:recombinase family protein n=1 Tax=Alkalibacillus sp. S2W TaxID=3386553 RepID=UPI00398CBE5E
MKNNYCFYVRYFSERTKKEQINQMLDFIQENNIPIKNTFYFEDYAKGSTQAREGLNQLLELAYNGEFTRLVVLIPQILHIDHYEYKKIEQDLMNYGINIIKLVGEDAEIDIQG